MIGYSFLINQIVIWISIVLFGYFLLWYFLQSFLFLLFISIFSFLVFSEVLFMLLGICWVASLIYYGKDLFCCIWNVFYNQNIFILSYSGVIRNIKNSFIFIWVGSIFHICFRRYFWNFHIAASMTCIAIFFKIFWEVIHKNIFSQKDHVFKDICLQRYKNLACHGRSTLIFLCPTTLILMFSSKEFIVLLYNWLPLSVHILFKALSR